MEYKIIDFDGLSKQALQDALNKLQQDENWSPVFAIPDTTWMVLARPVPQSWHLTVQQQQESFRFLPYFTPISNAG